MLIDLQTLEEVRSKFMKLGVTVTDLSKNIRGSVEEVQRSLAGIQRQLETAINPEAIQSVETATKEIARVSGEYAQYFNRFEGTFGSLDNFGQSLENASTHFDGLASDIEELSAGAPSAGGLASKASGASKRKKQTSKNQVPGMLKKEYSSAKGKVRGMLSALKIPAIGAIGAGTIAWMAYGFQEKDRLRAQAGEATNIMIAAFDGMSKDMVNKGTAYVASFQENMQKFFGISKDEVQNVAKAFVEGGISIEEMLSGFDKKLGMVGKNFISFSLGVDKMYEMAGGTTAQQMVSYAEKYGKSMEEAKNTVERLYFLGQESGLGARSFVQIIEQAGDSLAKLGFSIDAVADLAVDMQAKFEEIGVPKRFAGRQIAMGLDQMSSGLANMSEGWQSLIAEKMGYGTGLEGRQRLLEASVRVAEGDSAEETERFITTTVNTVMESVRGDAVRSRYILEKDLGFGFEGARIAKMITDAANAGDREKAKQITKQYRKQISDALLTERQKQSKFQRHMNEWMKGLADIGQGLLGMLGHFLVYLLAFFKTLAIKIGDFLGKKGDKQVDKIWKEVAKMSSDMKGYKNLVKRGFGKLGSSGKKMSQDVLGKTFGNLEKIMDLDVDLGGEPESPVAPRQRQVPMPDIPATVKMIPIPVSQPGVYEAGTPEEKYKSMLAKVNAYTRDIGGDPWVGGELNIISQGVDEEGNISVGLVGNCPKCGLKFGEGFDLAGYQRELAAMPAPGEVEVFNRNTQETAVLNPTTEAGMVELSKIGRDRAARKAGEAGTLDPKLGGIVKQISERFPGRQIQMYTGYRKGEKGQHGRGRAMDIGVAGVSSKDLFRFLRSNVKGGGKGYYPNEPYVHVDVRPGSAVWVDFTDEKGPGGVDKLGGASANEWLSANVGWERGSETSKRYESKGPKQSNMADLSAEQTVME